MGLYETHLLPRLTHWAMGAALLAEYRRRVAGAAQGHVLELGIGSGRNLPFYGTGVERVTGIDPSEGLLALAARGRATATVPVDLIEGTAEALPLGDASIDTVLVTWSLCSIPDPHAALAEARRVLRPGGRFLFVEHGQSPDLGVRRWQDRLTPLWRRCAGGCHLNRPVAELVRGAGFDLCELRTGYAPGPRVMAYLYEGCAQRSDQGETRC